MDKKKRLRDPNDWRVGDVVVEGPDWSERNAFGICAHCGKAMTWAEYWAWEQDPRNPYTRSGKKPVPVVEKVARSRGNVDWIRLSGGSGSFGIGPKAKRYILNPACKNGGYRETNAPDQKYATDSQGRFIHAKATTPNA